MKTAATTGTQADAQPFHVGDRIRKAREHVGQDRQTFANAVGIHRETLARYEESGQAKRSALISIAWNSSVRLEWLETGELPWLNDEKGRPEERPSSADVPPTGVEPATYGTNVRRLIPRVPAHLARDRRHLAGVTKLSGERVPVRALRAI